MYLPDKLVRLTFTSGLNVLILGDGFILFGSTSTSNEEMLI